jgi:hypothetical protein
METNGEAIGKLFLGDAIGVRWTDEVLFCILPDVNRPPTVWGVRAVPYTDSKRYIPGLISKSALPVSLGGEVLPRSPASIRGIHDPS